MKFIHLAVAAAALTLAGAGAAAVTTVTYPASLLAVRTQQVVQKHRDVVEAAVANSAYGQAMLARYDSGEAGPVATADMWWVHGYQDDRALSLVDGEVIQGEFRTAGDHREDGIRRPAAEQIFMAMQVLNEDVAVVPEADTWAMLLAGVAVVGVTARRRRNDAA